MKNPIFIEYYSHENTDCYKICNPWTKYNKETLVLCRVEEGLEKAQELANKYITKWLEKSLKQPLIKLEDQ